MQIFEPYNNPFWDFKYGGWKIKVILPEERGYICNENSGLPKFAPLSLALRSNQ
jgi:hypothetical protein